ncbi:MAG: hypothetical protein Q8J97_08970, partial [Flavobacteriaceae bacterium]|nr:hypothetical protein [Flavobacteriaceae bacterium]
DMEKEKRAINEKYDNWIKQVTEQGAVQAEIDKLNELRLLAIAQVQSNSVLKLSTFYQQLYGNIDQLSANGLRSLQTQLNEVLASALQIEKNGQTLIQVSIPSDEFDKDGKRIQKTVNMTIEEFQRLKEAGQNLDDQYSELRPFEALIKSFGDYQQANKAVRDAQEELNQLQESGTASTEALARANDKVTQAQNARTTSLQKTTASLNKIGNSGREIVGAANEVIGTLEDLGISIGDNTKKSIEGTGKMFDALAEIDLTKPFSIVTSAIKFVAGLGKTIAGIFGMASKKKIVSEETFAQYERLIDTIDQVISKQKEMLASLSGIDAKAQYDESIALIEKQIEATKNLGTDFLNSGADWNSRSAGYKLRESLKRYAADFNSIGIDFGGLGARMTGLFDLSPEQLTTIKEQLPEAWASLDDKTRQYLQTLIDSNSAVDDLKA